MYVCKVCMYRGAYVQVVRYAGGYIDVLWFAHRELNNCGIILESQISGNQRESHDVYSDRHPPPKKKKRSAC